MNYKTSDMGQNRNYGNQNKYNGKYEIHKMAMLLLKPQNVSRIIKIHRRIKQDY